IMTHDVVTVNPETTLKELVKIIKEHRINGVPVVNADGALVGIITMTDLLKILKEINYWDSIEKIKPGIGVKEAFIREKEQATVSKKMTRQVSTVLEGDSVDHVVDLMCKHNIHTIPVVKDNKLVGIIGATDIINVSFL
ncbi:MAG: CBS domain-containing protein, partial [Candidatus Omnitrophica bacterium]|nr:CBS domain-containing protein [Candidatus Omnitrophota bacterium]